MKTLITAAALILMTATAALADHSKGKGHKGDRGEQGEQGTNGADGAEGRNGTNGVDGLNGTDGATGSSGSDGVDGRDGANALGSLSFTAASASFYGDGIGFGLSDSTTGDLEGSIVMGYDITYEWRLIGGVTTDFKGNDAVSVAIGFSF